MADEKRYWLRNLEFVELRREIFRAPECDIR